MKIKGIDNLSLAEIDAEVEAGGRFVYYQYCISLLLVSFRRASPIVFLRADDRGMVRGLPYTLMSLLLGWWGLPWGVIYTLMAVFSNLAGGHDVTLAVRRFLAEQLAPAEMEAPPHTEVMAAWPGTEG
jgi:hypothetical protein